MRDQRATDDVVGRAAAEHHAVQQHVDLRGAVGRGVEVVHVAGMVRAVAGAAVRRAERIEVAAGAAGIGRAAIAALMHVEGKAVVGLQAAEGAGDAHATGGGDQRQLAADQTAGGRRQHGLRLLHGAGTISGLKPNSEHGFHIHEFGDCSAPDGSSAGGHFNPAKTEHGQVGSDPHHGGDMPNLKADADGKATIDAAVSNNVNIGKGDGFDILNHAVIVHADPDDYKTQPTGNAGGRLACGVIKGDAAAAPAQ